MWPVAHMDCMQSKEVKKICVRWHFKKPRNSPLYLNITHLEGERERHSHSMNGNPLQFNIVFKSNTNAIDFINKRSRWNEKQRERLIEKKNKQTKWNRTESRLVLKWEWHIRTHKRKAHISDVHCTSRTFYKKNSESREMIIVHRETAATAAATTACYRAENQKFHFK